MINRGIQNTYSESEVMLPLCVRTGTCSRGNFTFVRFVGSKLSGRSDGDGAFSLMPDNDITPRG